MFELDMAFTRFYNEITGK